MAQELTYSKFYYIGRGLPMYYTVRGMRYILFGSLPNKMGENIGVMIAWAVGSLILGSVIMYLQERKAQKNMTKAQEMEVPNNL
jgi:ABC-type polysaccharide/polyol phosphate export permease